MKIEEFKNSEVREAETNNKAEKELQNAQNHKAHREKLEDYSCKELFEMVKKDPDRVIKLNADFRKKYEAEIRDMTVEEYRDHKSKLSDGDNKTEHLSRGEKFEEKNEKSEQRGLLVFYEQTREKNKSFITNGGEHKTYGEAVKQISDRAETYMKEMGVSEDKIKAVKSDIEAEIFKQHEEAKSRGIGDHGIRHIYGNFERSESYLNTRNDVSSEQKLGVLIAQTYHDEGYTQKNDLVNNSGVLHGGFDKKHDLASLEVWNSKKDLYETVFSKETISSVDKAIGEHNVSVEDDNGVETIKANTSKEADVIVSTVHITDKLALSGREKFSELLYTDPKLIELTEGMNSMFKTLFDEKSIFKESDEKQNSKFLEKYHSVINDYIDSKYSPEDAVKFIDAVNKDIGFNSGKFTSRMNYIYTPSDCYRYNPETKTNEITVYKIDHGDTKSQDLQNDQLKKLYKDLGLNDDEIVTAIKQGGYEDKDRGLSVHVETKTVDEIRNIESEKHQENNDLREVNERIDAGREQYQELNNKFLEIVENLEATDINYEDYDKMCKACNKSDGCTKSEFEGKTETDRKKLIIETVSEMIITEVSNTLGKEKLK